MLVVMMSYCGYHRDEDLPPGGWATLVPVLRGDLSSNCSPENVSKKKYNTKPSIQHQYHWFYI